MYPLGKWEFAPSDSIIGKYHSNDEDWLWIAENWPTFLYDEQAGWNEHHIKNGLFCGHVLVRVCSFCLSANVIHFYEPTLLGCPSHLPQHDCCPG